MCPSGAHVKTRPSIHKQLTSGSEGQTNGVSASTGFGTSRASAPATADGGAGLDRAGRQPPATSFPGLPGTHPGPALLTARNLIINNSDTGVLYRGDTPLCLPRDRRHQHHLGRRQKCTFSGPRQTPNGKFWRKHSKWFNKPSR